ncbi:6417_t:CDS:10 [Entrophospora sp. SA101]|nr:2851_t:CDS:10 [Entrophospora sp. SA101]CAJ0747310.1 16242_t:CDS:10 [Entrophospora sp. SA101]CAJ0763640.1 6417_t:CDS:10 [Entrophospora sp. SA101]CAJ0875771.1 10851_t:CDS:10 [Entrophospora sp. SA101]CAJ0910874.1 9117_t:CDS:10 [Entrophospora sp. SA101]
MSALDRLVTIQNHLKQPTGSIDLANERANAKFDVKQLHWLFEGGKEYSDALDLAYQIIQRDPDLYMTAGHNFDLTRPEEREHVARQIRRFKELEKSLNDPLLLEALKNALYMYSASYKMKVYVNDVLFYQTFKIFGTPEQYDKWTDDVKNWRIVGCFAMTELGYSSFIRGLETTATYNQATDEFIIHSPTLMSTKWWIGMAGQTATHSSVLCQTIVNGKDCGLNWFIVPLRDHETAKLLPGVTAGDLGAKSGRNGLDNGWIQFSCVRIPRENMLMKWSKVTRDGKFTPSPNPAIFYATLICERLACLPAVKNFLSQALTVACRYGCVRRQGPNKEKIMDYQTHYVRLMPCVASVYVFNVVNKLVSNRWEEILSYTQTNQQEFLRNIGDIHVISSGIKVTSTWWGCEVLERCRRSLGGHAYSSYNAIGGAIDDFGGGDNYVLIQQTAKYLLEAIKDVFEGKKVHGSVKYLNNYNKYIEASKSNLTSLEQLLDLYYSLEMYTWLVVKRIKFLASVKNITTDSNRWNENQVYLVKLGEIYTHQYMMSEYIRGLEIYSQSTTTEYKNLLPILTDLGRLWFIHVIHDSLELYLEEGYFTREQVDLVRRAYLDLCKQLREQVIPLVDAWGLPDFIIKAPLGRYDGDIYTAYFDVIRSAPNCIGVPKYWQDHIKPLTSSTTNF